MGEQLTFETAANAAPDASHGHVPASALSVGGGISARHILTSPLNALALSKVLREENIKEARGCLKPGDYAINALLRMSGSMKVGEDYEQYIVAKADTWGLLFAALSKLNSVTLDKLLREYFENQDNLDKAGWVLSQQAKSAIEAIKGKTKMTCRGRVTPRLTCEMISNESGSIEVARGRVRKVKSKG